MKKGWPYHAYPPEVTKRTGVYIICCTINGKVYVGSASKSFMLRWSMHLHQFIRGINSRHLQRAWEKHGEEAFEVVIVAFCAPEDCVSEEQRFIDQYDACNPEKGYNIAKVAGSNRGVKSTAETLAKVSAGVRRFFTENPEAAKARDERLRANHNDPVIQSKKAATLRKTSARPDVREAKSKRMREVAQRPGMRELRARLTKEGWENPATRDARASGIRKARGTLEARQQQSDLLRTLLADPQAKSERVAAIRAGKERKRQMRAETRLAEVRERNAKFRLAFIKGTAPQPESSPPKGHNGPTQKGGNGGHTT